MLNASIAAFAHRAISERSVDALAAEALACLASALGADNAELLALDAERQTLEVTHRWLSAAEPAAERVPLAGGSICAAAYARKGVVIKELERVGDERQIERGYRYGAAVAVPCDADVCVFVAYSREKPFDRSIAGVLDAVAAMYAAARARGVAEAQLADRESRLRLIFNQIPAVISTLDRDLIFTSVQGAGMGAISPEHKRLIGRSLAEVIEGDENSLPVIAARTVLAGTPMRYEWTWLGRTYENRMEPLRDPEGGVAGFVNLGVDVTERCAAEAALHESREELRRLSAAMNQIQENQRRRIGREIHDDLGQRLTALRLDVGLLRTELRGGRTAEAEERTSQMLHLIDETLATVRRVAMELRPAILDDFGFRAAIEQEVENFARRTGTNVALNIVPEDVAVEPARATALYRIIQEALTNVARHAGASRVDVRIERRNGGIEAEVRDNGRGITDEQMSNRTAIGLIGIRERVFAFGGGVVFERIPAGGTRLFVSVPDEDTDRG